MKDRQTVYLIRRGRQYLQSYVAFGYETDPEKMVPIFSTYKYDAWRCMRASTAAQVARLIKSIKHDDAPYVIDRFDKLTGDTFFVRYIH